MNGAQARAAADHCRGQGVDFLLLLHGGFTMGDLARAITLTGLPMGVWATPEPVHEAAIQLNNFVSLNMSLSIARGCRDLASQPVQWYFGAPEDKALRAPVAHVPRAFGTQGAERCADFLEFAAWANLRHLAIVPAHDGLPLCTSRND